MWDLRRNGQLHDRRAVALLRYGRHFRLTPRVKAIIGRDSSENAFLDSSQTDAEVLLTMLPAIPGPNVIITGPAGAPEILIAARLGARYSDVRNLTQVTIVTRQAGQLGQMDVPPATDMDIERLKI